MYFYAKVNGKIPHVLHEPVIAEIPPALDWSIYLARLRVMLDSGNAFSSNVLLNIPNVFSSLFLKNCKRTL